MKQRRLARWFVAGAMVTAITISATAAPAAVDQCQAKLASNSLKLKISMAKALLKCKNAVRKDQVQGGNYSKAADVCEKVLKAIYGLTFPGDPKPILPDKTKIGKFLAAVNKLSDVGTCTEADLTELGHLVTGINAPGGARGPFCTDGFTGCTKDADCPAGESCPGSIEFAKAWLVKAEEKLAWKEDVFEIGDSVSLIQAAIQAPADTTNCDEGSGKSCGTTCNYSQINVSGNVGGDGLFPRPNLCMLNAGSWPKCHDVSCTLSLASGAVLQPVGIPIGLSARRVGLEVCMLPTDGSLPVDGGHCVCDATFGLGTCIPNTPCIIDGPAGSCGFSPLGLPGTCYPDYQMIIGQPARNFSPPPTIPIIPTITACLDQVRSEGWCDCNSIDAGIPYNPSFCQDHDADPLGTCPDTGAALEDNCVCGFPAGPSCQVAGCLACVNGSTGARCHSGTQNSDVTAAWTGASTSGDCVIQNTIAFKLLPPAICLDAFGNPLGQCSVPGPADPGCVMVGGVVCLDARGADLEACTSDDLVPPSAPTVVPFTTGLATSTVEDFVAVEGTCVNAGAFGRTCATLPDCDTAVGLGDGACAAPITGCGTGPNIEDCQFTAGPGAGLSCQKYESGRLTGWTLVGGFPSLDGAGGIGDAIYTFTLNCM